ncbi:hypothetical protein BXT89_03145 [Halopseudomonas pachastrellae]|uniref:Uncharacterized protein n=1 Tax=Halopseudomonas pachastrellae TaxID=254161 RepID=A0A1S8DJ70_9GAMM|nr:hypothetical protein [Halopseudomonas pachastrellae]ONM45433.1 hypothetical protein BXT89_03145 [Halopseudomonas pachastrellae]SFL71971.1 hypothetical protein SAMN05216256_101126 [Halopseudomonas pachastrellae]
MSLIFVKNGVVYQTFTGYAGEYASYWQESSFAASAEIVEGVTVVAPPDREGGEEVLGHPSPVGDVGESPWEAHYWAPPLPEVRFWTGLQRAREVIESAVIELELDVPEGMLSVLNAGDAGGGTPAYISPAMGMGGEIGTLTPPTLAGLDVLGLSAYSSEGSVFVELALLAPSDTEEQLTYSGGLLLLDDTLMPMTFYGIQEVAPGSLAYLFVGESQDASLPPIGADIPLSLVIWE